MSDNPPEQNRHSEGYYDGALHLNIPSKTEAVPINVIPSEAQEPSTVPAVDSHALARLNGHSWQDIESYNSLFRLNAINSGHSPAEIDNYLGWPETAPLQEKAKETWAYSAANNPEKLDVLKEPTETPVKPEKLLDEQDFRDTYAQSLINGSAKSAEDFANTYFDAAKPHLDDTPETAERIQHVASQVANSLPSHQEALDFALAITHESGNGLTPTTIATARANLLQHWAATQQALGASYALAQHDALFHDALAQPAIKGEPAGPGAVPGAVQPDPFAPTPKPGIPRPVEEGDRLTNQDILDPSANHITVQDPSFNEGQPTPLPTVWIKDGKAYVAHDASEVVKLAKESGLSYSSFDKLHTSIKPEDEPLVKEALKYHTPEQTAAALADLNQPGRDAINEVSLFGEPTENETPLQALTDLGVNVGMVVGGGYVLKAGTKIVGSAIKSKEGQYVLSGLARILTHLPAPGLSIKEVTDAEVKAEAEALTARLSKARGKAAPHLVPPETIVDDAYIRQMDDDINRLRTNDIADKVTLMKIINAQKEEWVNPEFQENVSTEVESRVYKNPEKTLEAEAFLEANKALTDRQTFLGKEIARKTDGANFDVEDEILYIRSVDEGYVHRVAKGKGAPGYAGPFDPANPTNVITGASGRPLSKWAPSVTKSRLFYVLEDAEGNRIFGQKPLKSIANPALKPEDIGKLFTRQRAIFGDKLVGANGTVFTIKRATMEEVEANTNVRYHKSFLANTIENVAKLERVNRNIDFIQKHIKDLEKTGEFIPRPKFGMSEQSIAGLVRVAVPGVDGWAVPRVAYALNNMFDDSHDQLGPFLGKVCRFIVSSLFVSPVIHAMNVGAHWFVGRGWEWARPRGYINLVRDGIEAVHEVMTLGPKYIEHLRVGSGLQYASTQTENFYNVVTTKLFNEQLVDGGGAWSQLAKRIGFTSVKHMVQWEYKFSRQVLWAVNDMFMLQRQFELQRTGKTLEEAIRIAEKDIPNYRVPSEVMHSQLLSEFLKSPTIFNFGRYKYGQLNAIAHIATDLAKGTTGETRFEILGKAVALGGLGLGVYPLINAGISRITGNTNTTLRPAGPLAPIYAIEGFMTGQKEWVAAISSFLSLSPLFTLADALKNLSPWGSDLIRKQSTWQGQVVEGLEALANQIYPGQLLVNALKEGGLKKDIAALTGFVYKPPINEIGKARFDRYDRRAAIRFENKDAATTWLKDITQ